MIPPLVAKRKTGRFEQAKAEAARKKKEQSDADEAAAADLARRVKPRPKRRMNAALSRPPTGRETTSTTGRRATRIEGRASTGRQGMKSFAIPATLRKQQVRSLQGEARIAKAERGDRPVHESQGRLRARGAVRD